MAPTAPLKTPYRSLRFGTRAAVTDLDWDEFVRVDMRVGRIVEVEDFPEARQPAWKLRVDFGEEIGVQALVGADHELPARGSRRAAGGRRGELPAAADRAGALRGAGARRDRQRRAA